MTVRFAAPHSNPSRSLVLPPEAPADEELEVASLTADDLRAIAVYFEREAMETARHRASHGRRRNARTPGIRHSRDRGPFFGGDA